MNFKTIKFSYFSSEDPCDFQFEHELCWSRIYEYPFVLSEINFFRDSNISIHNCSWGFRDIHIVFKTWLDIKFKNSIHSDLRRSTLHKTFLWDITSPPNETLVGAFDVVINVSTLEEVSVSHVEVLKNHLSQLKVGGRFIGTFDVPGLQLAEIEEFLGQRIVTPPNALGPKNSRLVDKVLDLPESFKVGYVVIEKIA